MTCFSRRTVILQQRCGIAVGLGTLLLVAGCGARSEHAAQTYRAVPTSARYAILSRLFPRNAADASAGLQIQNFVDAIHAKAAAACLAKDGLPGPPGNLPIGGAVNTEFPDIASIASSGSTGMLTAYPAPYDPRTRMSSAEKSAYQAALTRCESVTDAPLRSLDQAVGATPGPAVALSAKWSNVLFQIDESHPVLAAGRQAQACTRRLGISFRPVNGRYEDGFLFAVQAVEAPLDQRGNHAQAVSDDRNAAHIFVACFGPLEVLRDRLRAARRAQFMDENAPAIQQLQQDVTSSIATLEQEYGVKF